MKDIRWPLVAVQLIGVTLFTFLAHEAAHWLAGRALGYDMVMRLNGAYPVGGFRQSGDATLVSAAGPAFTVLQALVALALTRRFGLSAYLFLFYAAFMRLSATAISLFHPNDEARVSLALGLGTWTLPLAVTAALVALTAIGARSSGLGWRGQAALYGLSTLTLTAVVFLDAALGRI